MFFDGDGELVENVDVKRVPLEEKIKSDDMDFIDFLYRCFEWMPERRITPNEALNHPWLQ